jgi:4-amino-4-deoxy-L-arabinose transferase-like glycosyltransferase
MPEDSLPSFNQSRTSKAGPLPVLLSLAFVLVAVCLIVSTYSKLSQTWDETAHIGTGIQWLTSGHYSLDIIDPPLPRVSVAVGPYLLGSRSTGLFNPWDEGDNILVKSGHIFKTLAAARLGILFYFLIACFLTWNMTRKWLGDWPAFTATALFATCPPILAHSGVATTDICFVATFLWALDRIWAALQEPTRLHYLLAGIAVGLACLSKLSAVPYLVSTGGVLLVFVVWKKRRFGSLLACLLFCLGAILTLWAGYHFSVGPMTRSPESLQVLNKLGPLRGPAFALAEHFPAYQFPQGIHQAKQMSEDPPDGYLLGKTYRGSVWYFYFVMLAVKTPLPLLLLTIPGFVFALLLLLRGKDQFVIVPILGIVFPILIATLSHINLGVRHVLVVYPFFAMLSALLLAELYRRRISQSILFSGLGILLAWQLTSCIRVAPDFLTYLNEPAAPYSAFICADSDFDWGQDLGRLSWKLNDLQATSGWIAYSGSAFASDFGLTGFKKLEPGKKESGWIAVSEEYFRKYPAYYSWLSAYQPVAEAGKTIRIYHVE